MTSVDDIEGNTVDGKEGKSLFLRLVPPLRWLWGLKKPAALKSLQKLNLTVTRVTAAGIVFATLKSPLTPHPGDPA